MHELVFVIEDDNVFSDSFSFMYTNELAEAVAAPVIAGIKADTVGRLVMLNSGQNEHLGLPLVTDGLNRRA